ncbi:MAG: fumarylacetoacetase [Bacteroidia bacterium]|nr:fumarylacetoacetase [Bacteroidia bacterium]
MTSWIEIDKKSDFTIYNIPFGVCSINGSRKRLATRVGDQVIDLAKVADLGCFQDLRISPSVFKKETLNNFISRGKRKTSAVRKRIQELLTTDSFLKDHPEVFLAYDDVEMHMPVEVKDYTDFYSSLDHATNVGKMFRDPENALLPNWKHLPVGYHGRASSIIVSGVDIHRPKGQYKPKDAKKPVFGPSQRMDFELEMAFIIGKSTKLGDSVKVNRAEDYIFGMVIFNDWSARDIQGWEYVPLGPFLGKSFASTISPWVVTMEALDLLRISSPEQSPKVLPYLRQKGQNHFDIDLKVGIRPENGEETIVGTSNFKHMYWSMVQQLAHHTVNGRNINVGDMMASGTISGPTEKSRGCMLEISWAGTQPITLNDGSQRSFLHDGDTVAMYASGEKDGKRIGFGMLESKLLPVK